MTARAYNRLTATIATVIFLFLSVVLASFTTRESTDAIRQRPSTFFTDPTGARALLLVMKQLLLSAEQWRRPLQFLALPNQPDIPTTLIVAGPGLPISQSELDYLDRWLAAGGQLILLTGNGWPTRQRLESAKIPEKTETVADDRVDARSVKFLSRYAPSLRWTKPGNAKTSESSGQSLPSPGLKLRWQRSFAETGDAKVIALAANEALAVEISVGQGRIIAIADPTMVSNGSLRRSDNSVWLVSLAAGWANGKILFDEYHHGFGDKRSTAELTRAFLMTPWGWCALQLAAAGLLYAFAYRRRFGRISETPMPERTSSLELVEARAGLLQAAAARGLAAELIVQNLCQDLTKAHGRAIDIANLSHQLDRAAKNTGTTIQTTALQALLKKIQTGASLNDQELINVGRSAGEILRGPRP
jgi:Domain of unknown function (DUF4350)